MTRYYVTQVATADLEEIIEWIAKSDVPTAEAFEVSAYAAFQLLAANPGIGHRRRYLTDRPVRFWT